MCYLDNSLFKICPIKGGKFFAKGPIFKFFIYFVSLIFHISHGSWRMMM